MVVFHAAERNGHNFAIGAAGVDIFFVISGFIMWVIADAGQTTPLRFVGDRLKRIAPSYWIITAVMVAGALAGMLPNIVLSWQHVAGSFLFIPHQSPTKGEVWPVLVQGWTLNYEMFFYVLFAAVLCLRRSARLAALCGIFGALVLAGYWLEPEGPVWTTYTRPIILEFLLGIFLARWWLGDGAARIQRGAGIAALATATGIFLLIALTGSSFNVFVYGPLAGLLLFGLLVVERKGALGRSRMLAYLGDSSYSIYLWHTAGIAGTVKIAAMLDLPTPITVAAGIVAGVALGALAYEVIERPIARLLKRDLRWPYRGPEVRAQPVKSKP